MAKKKKRKYNQKGLFILMLLALITILSSVLIPQARLYLMSRAEGLGMNPTMKQGMLDFGLPTEAPLPTPTDKIDPITKATVTPAPIPTVAGTACNMDNIKEPKDCKCGDLDGFKCQGDMTDGVQNFHFKSAVMTSDTEGQFLGVKGMYLFRTNQADYDAYAKRSDCKNWCVGKPVIYLYPTEPTYISVSVDVPGSIFISDPFYPEGGWQNVLAYPDGALEYEGQKYTELYYETDLDTDVKKPETGILIPRAELATQLDVIITKLGLVHHERVEFLDYWLPQLEALDSPFIEFSVLDEAEKNRIDTVHISPKPDTFIGFIAYFRPVWNYEVIKPLSLPETPPARIGYTAVEWGGTIESVTK